MGKYFTNCLEIPRSLNHWKGRSIFYYLFVIFLLINRSKDGLEKAGWCSIIFRPSFSSLVKSKKEFYFLFPFRLHLKEEKLRLIYVLNIECLVTCKFKRTLLLYADLLQWNCKCVFNPTWHREAKLCLFFEWWILCVKCCVFILSVMHANCEIMHCTFTVQTRKEN